MTRMPNHRRMAVAQYRRAHLSTASSFADSIMPKTQLTPFLLLLGLPAQALAQEPGTRDFSLLFLLFLSAFTLILVMSSIPRAWRVNVVSPEILRAFALGKGLVDDTADTAHDTNGDRSETFRQWLSTNPAVKPSAIGRPVFRGRNGGFPFVIDEVWVSKRLGNSWQRQPFLRMIIDLPEMPATLQVFPARFRDQLAGRAGLMRSRIRPHGTGGLVARFSKRPVDRAKERMFLNDERRRLLEDFEAEPGGVYIHDGKLFLIRRRDEVTGPDLHTLYENIATLATRLNAHN